MTERTSNSTDGSVLVRSNTRNMRRLLSSVAILSLFANYSHSFAADFTVLTPTIVTNGSAGNILNGNDSLTITSTGEIIVTGAHAVDASGIENVITNDGIVQADSNNFNTINVQNDFNTVTNNGSIFKNGDDGDGIHANDSNSIINNGTIVTQGINADGIDVDDNNTAVINNGVIRVLGDSSNALVIRDNNEVVINNGLIESQTTGNPSSAIAIGDDNKFFNHGTIVNFNGVGIYLSDRNEVTNTGSIFVYGDLDRGINASGSGGNTVTNSGLIYATGTGAQAIDAYSNATVTNSGKLVSEQGSALNLPRADIILNLLAPSFIGGEIDMGAQPTTINITTGPSHSILWDFSTGTMVGGDPTIDGTVPWFYNSTTKQIATFDPSVLAASVETLTDRTAMISATIQRRLEAAELMINGVQRGKPDGYGSEMGAGPFDKSGVWVQVMASHSEYAGGAATLDRDITLGGFAIGYDASHDKNTRFGLMAGYIDGSSEAASRWSNSFKGNSSGFFAAGYGRKSYGRLFVDLGLSAGIGTDNETKRFVNDNLAALGESYAMGDAGTSFWISPEVAIGTQIKAMSHWTFAPTAKLRYAAEWLGGYTETGPSADANATVDDRMIAIGEARLELAASRNLHFGSAMHALFTARGGVLGRASLGEDDATITLLGVTQDISDFYEESFAIFAGVDTSIAMSEMINLDLSSSATFGNDMTNVQGAAAVSVAF